MGLAKGMRGLEKEMRDIVKEAMASRGLQVSFRVPEVGILH